MVTAGGLPTGLTQVGWWVRVFISVANCVAVSPIVRWCCNGLFRLAEVFWSEI